MREKIEVGYIYPTSILKIGGEVNLAFLDVNFASLQLQ
jgi:hypothetical protein